MIKYSIKRLLQLIFVLFGATFLTFIVSQATPSDPAEMKYAALGIVPSSELLEQTREEMGINDPIIVQYGRWVKNVCHMDLGNSLKYGEPVKYQMARKLPVTLKLATVSGICMILFSLPLGIYAAVKKNKLSDYIIRFVSFGGISMPNFWLALLLMYIFSIRLGWFNVIASDHIKDMVLPVATISIPIICRDVRQIRTAILEEYNSNYVIGARARGISERRILFCHILVNAIHPIITILGLSIGALFGGTAIVETIFSLRGLGDMVVQAIRVRDYPLIQGYVLWMTLIYVFVNLIVDIVCQFLDPQARIQKVNQDEK